MNAPTPRDSKCIERFWARVDKSGECWIWTGDVGDNGYGRMVVGGKRIPAHRFSYELQVGPIPDGLLMCHNCPGGDNPLCVNPAHLWPGTVGDNLRDAYAKGFRNSKSRSTHCSAGHPLEGPNLRIRRRKSGAVERECVACCRRRCNEGYSRKMIRQSSAGVPQQ